MMEIVVVLIPFGYALQGYDNIFILELFGQLTCTYVSSSKNKRTSVFLSLRL